jgi:hypothetical protein
MDPVELESFVDQRLKHLRPPRAPETLLPRVLQAARGWADRPWYARAWLTWPAGWRLASLAALAGLAAGIAWAAPRALSLLPSGASAIAASSATVIQLAEQVQLAMHAGRILWRALVEPVAPAVSVAVFLLCVVCAACGTMLNRVALGRT